MQLALLLSFLALPFHSHEAASKRDPLSAIVSSGPGQRAPLYLGGCPMPEMPQIADARRVERWDPRGVAGVVVGHGYVEGSVSGVAMRPAESRALAVTSGFVTWF
jgi:hypothetical protein